MIGQIVSHYKILEKLGEGGMGVVYKAEDTKLKRTVALKFLPPELTKDPEAKERFIHEAQAASALDHNNICTIHGVGETDDGKLYIVMACYEGKTLKNKIAYAPLNVEEAIDIMIQVAQGLSKAHEKGIIHRDIKPANILLTEDGIVKMLDFGLAKLRGLTKLTKTGSTVGTLLYMSPEQAKGENVDHRTDIWSLGIVLYEMMTGQLPFKGEYEQAIIYQIINATPEPITSLCSRVPMELERIVNKCLEKSADERYQTAVDLIADLKHLQRTTGNLGTQTVKQKQITVNIKKYWYWTVAAVVLLLLGLGSWLLFRSEARHATFRVGRSSQLTSEPGIKLDQAVSPDCKMIAYSGYFKGTLRVLVKQVMGGRTICLTDGMPGYQRFPQWSTDCSEITFVNSPSEERFIVPALGGAPRKAPNGICSPDGKRFIFTAGDTVYLQAADDMQRSILTVMKEPHFFSWSTDGSLIVFVSGNPMYRGSLFPANVAPSSIYVISMQGGSIVQITDNTSLNTSPSFSGDRRHLFFVSNRDGTRDIYSVALGRSGQPEGKPERLTTGMNVYTISLSADSKILTYSVLTHSANIWSIEIPQANWVSVREAKQVTTGNQVIEIPGISTDGQWLAYDCNRDGVQHIFKIPLKGGEPIQLTRGPGDNFSPSWSPDGKMIAFHSFRTGNPEIFIMMNDGTNQQQITHDSGVNRQPLWSPDGNQIVYYSNRLGKVDIYLVSRNAGTGDWGSPRQMTFGAGVNYGPHWSPNGFWIAYISNGIRLISPQGGNPRILVSDDDPSVSSKPTWLGWSQDSRMVYYKAYDETEQTSFWAVPLEGGKPRLLVKFDDPTKQSSRPDFTTDGKRFFFTISKYEGDIWKMELIKEE